MRSLVGARGDGPNVNVARVLEFDVRLGRAVEAEEAAAVARRARGGGGGHRRRVVHVPQGRRDTHSRRGAEIITHSV